VSHWSDWSPALTAFTVGAEEEAMLLHAGDLVLASAGERVLAALPRSLSGRIALELHAAAVEVQTGVHPTAGGAAAEIAELREALAAHLAEQGLRAAGAGLYPMAPPGDLRVSERPRYRRLLRELGALARRDPTYALHVHVGVPDPEAAVRALNHVRARLPLLLAAAANSPFWGGRDCSLASARITLFDSFPRSGPPRAFRDYADYVEALDSLIVPRAIPDATHLWWDIRLQPALGTIEIRIMDAQIGVAETAALIAMVQCMVRAGLHGPAQPLDQTPEALAENRFLAARDGLAARLIDGRRRVAARTLLRRELAACRPHARALGCERELDGVGDMIRAGGAERQRAWAAERGVGGVLAALADAYLAEAAPPRRRAA
jgi:carboxylate-amine ligase